MTKPVLFLISGPSGAGKSSLMKALMDNEIISFTTRKQRAGETEGKDYYFITTEKYHELDAKDGLFEKSVYAGNFYGITQKEFDTKMNRGHAFFVVNLDGMKQTQELYNHCVSIFIHTTFDDIKKQLTERGETNAFIEKRTATYKAEMKNVVHYDYVVRNTYGKFEDTLQILRAIIAAETN